MNSYILVTGGAGYIGSHAVLALIEANYNVVVIDNFANSSYESLNRISSITGRELIFIQGDVRDRIFLDGVFARYKIAAVFHFAGLKSVSESVIKPLRYYENNVYGSQVLLQAMANADVFTIIFSSSATIYGDPDLVPISEDCASKPCNPYGRTKSIIEEMLRDVVIADNRWRVAILRYFNPIGAHTSGLLGEDSIGIPNNLLPFITQVAIGKLSELFIFGDDYATPDGTGVRDYIHVVDLVDGHLKALDALQSRTGLNVWNLGAGRGYSVLEVVKTFEQVSGHAIPYSIAPRRPGDIGVCYANTSKAADELGWQAKHGLVEMVRDAWRWQSSNPNGYSLSLHTS
jgi:UDP-glucose 4-epimerase